MDPFAPTPPSWTEQATHALEFFCPRCGASSREAKDVWVNRRSPVYTEDHRRKLQEFYQCECGAAWWAWSTDRPPPEETPRDEFDLPDLPDLP